jgi:8-oxo-dGTP diphosphatase
MKHYQVVAAVICHDGKYLCMQKGKTKYEYTSYKYEFPGGKVEAGETDSQALSRELMEEMDYHIKVESHLVTVHHVYPDFEITMAAYLCSADSTSFTMKEHIGYKWLTADKLEFLDWAAADVDVVKVLI